MLYKDKNSEGLDINIFKNPTAVYRATPFWGWNTKLEKYVLERQINYFKEMGFGGFHIHTRAGLSEVYLGDVYMDCVKHCTDKAKEVGLLSWLYDEDVCPSGFGGGYVTKTPKYRQRYLAMVPYGTPLPEFSDFEDAIENGKAYYICSFDIELNEDGTLKNYRQIDDNENINGSRWDVYCAVPNDDIYGGYPYVDVLNKEATMEFIRVTHEKFKSLLGDEFGGVVPAIFTDEPQHIPKGMLKTAFDKVELLFPWTGNLPRLFEEKYGTSIIEKIPELFWNLPDGQMSKYRYCVHEFIAELFVKSFADVIGEWCENNNILFTGHMKDEPDLYYQTLTIGEAMRHYRGFHIPGVDILCDIPEYTTVKQAQSAAHQYGREGVLSELYGVTNWDFDFRGHKHQGDWQAALGVTVRVPHISWLSMEGIGKRDFPAAINYQSPWYKEYKYIEDHFARLATVLTRGKPDVKIGVIHPIESYWTCWGVSDQTDDIRSDLEQKFQTLIKWLLFSTNDFDYICESQLDMLHSERNDNLFNVGKMNYSVIIVSGLITMRRTTFEALKKFSLNGGKIIFIGKCPEYIDAEKTDEVYELFEKSTQLPFDKISLINTLAEYRDIDIFNEAGERATHYIYTMREEKACKWLFVARGEKNYGERIRGKSCSAYYDINVAHCDNVKIKIKGLFVPEVYNTLTGCTENIKYEYISGNTVVYYGMYGETSLLLKLVAGQGDCNYREDNEAEGVMYPAHGKHFYELEEPNVLLLDRAAYCIDDEEFENEEEMRRIEKKLYKRFNINHITQPWFKADTDTGHILTLQMKIESAIDTDNAHLAIERPENKELYFNGEKLENVADGYFVDEYIKTIKLPPIKQGTNILVVKTPFTGRTTVEWCYVLGDFGVVVEGSEATIVSKPEKIGYSPLKMQRMPFYGGNITYFNEIEVNDCSMEIAVPYYRGAAVKVYVDDMDLGNVSLAPYKVKVDNIRKGKHIVKIKLFGNRYNSFAPLHNTNSSQKWIDPYAWQTEDEEFGYEYQLADMGVLAAPKIIIKEKRG